MSNPDYYLLERDLKDNSRRIDQSSHFDHSFIMGSLLESTITPPVIFDVDAECGGRDVPSTFLPQPVFSLQLVDHLRSLGVANLEIVSVLINVLAGTPPLEGYVLVNVVGVVSCANLNASRFEEFDGMYDFDEIVIDVEAARGHDFFRLAEAPDYLVVSGRIADRIDRTAFSDIKLVPLRSV